MKAIVIPSLLPLAAAVLSAPAMAGGVPEDDRAAREKPGEVCVRGTFSDAGVECQAFVGEDGTLYTLAPRPRGAAADRAACVCGEPAAMSICMQGQTLANARAAEPERCE